MSAGSAVSSGFVFPRTRRRLSSSRIVTSVCWVIVAIAVWTCSRPSSERTVTRVTRTTTANAEAARAIAGKVRCSRRPPKPEPSPRAGSQCRSTANTASSTIAATNDGIAASTVEIVTTVESTTPRRSPAATPRPTPKTTISTPA